jgi:hypothetical protein
MPKSAAKDAGLTNAVYVRHYVVMSDTMTPGKRRTVRFASEIDRLIASRAAVENKSISDIIRISVLAGLHTGEVSAGEWIRTAAKNVSPRPPSPERLAFRKKYRERHQ